MSILACQNAHFTIQVFEFIIYRVGSSSLNDVPSELLPC